MKLGELMAILVTGPPEAEVMAEGLSTHFFPLVPVRSVEFSLRRLESGQELFVVTLKATSSDHPELPPRD